MLIPAITLHNGHIFAKVVLWIQLPMIQVFLESEKLLLRYFMQF